jgi:hypothetical protein
VYGRWPAGNERPWIGFERVKRLPPWLEPWQIDLVGLFNSINKAFGGADAALLQSGIPALGRILSAAPSGGTVQVGGGLVERTCDFQVLVLMDGQVPYRAAARQRVPEVYLAQLQSGAAGVAIRVDPADPQKIALDLRSAPPVPRIAQSTGPGTASYIRENGRDGTAVIVASAPLGYENYLGYPMQTFTLTVVDGAPQPYQTQAASAVPPASLPLVFPGSKVHVKIGDQPHEVVVDFDKGSAA